MLGAAAVLAGCLLLLAVVLPRLLAGASWASRSPVLALLLWQVAGLAGGILAIEIAVTLALSPAGATHGSAIAALRAGEPSSMPAWSGVALASGVLVFLRLLSVLLASVAVTLRARRHHRTMVDLVGTRNPLLPGTHVLDHELPVAYCLPGLRSRVVLSSGVLALLRDEELRAVLAHEAAHVEQRHDLVVLPFAALRATFPVLPGVRAAAGEVGLLVEMLADDGATRRHPRDVLARALYKVGTAQVPRGGLAAGGNSVLLRAQRLLEPAQPLPGTARLAVVLAIAAVLALPPLGLVLPMLIP